MKTRTKTTALVAALLTGATIAGAHQPEQRRQGPPHGQQPQWQAPQQVCPHCGSSGVRQQPKFQQRRRQPQSQRRQQQPQFQQRRQQQPQLQQHRRQLLKKFDRDGDGRLSEKERKALKKHINRQRRNRGNERPECKAKPAPEQVSE